MRKKGAPGKPLSYAVIGSPGMPGGDYSKVCVNLETDVR